MYTFIQQDCIKLIKYYVTKDFELFKELWKMPSEEKKLHFDFQNY